LLERFYPKALEGDEKAAELVLKISNQRAKLIGLYPQPGQPNLNVNIGGEVDAREGGIQVRFVKGGWEERPDGSLWQNGKMFSRQTRRSKSRPPRRCRPRLITGRMSSIFAGVSRVG